MLKQTQSQKQVQKALPQLIQRQNLLAIPTLSVEQLIRQELEVNPFLEDEEITEETEEKEEEIKTDETDITDETVKEETEKAEDEFDLDDYMNSETDGFKTEDYEGSPKEVNYENIWRTRTTLHENILSQLNLAGFSEKETFIGEKLVSYIDDDGYMRENVIDILDDIEKDKIGTEFEDLIFSEKDVCNVLSKIQKFEPVGIASRNLKECLLIQIESINEDESLKNLCRRILTDYFEE